MIRVKYRIIISSVMNVSRFFKSIYQEFKHIVWPNQAQTIGYTVAVVILTVVIAYYLGLFDWVFSMGLEVLLNR